MTIAKVSSGRTGDRAGQTWSIDFAVSLVIFLIGVFLLVTFLFNIEHSGRNDLQDQASEALQASTLLLTQGIPSNWTDATVVVGGILDDTDLIDEAKWTRLQSLAANNVSIFKHALGTRFKLQINLLNKTGSVLDSIGSLGDTNNQVQVLRIARLNQSIVRLQVIAWS